METPRSWLPYDTFKLVVAIVLVVLYLVLRFAAQ